MGLSIILKNKKQKQQQRNTKSKISDTLQLRSHPRVLDLMGLKIERKVDTKLGRQRRKIDMGGVVGGVNMMKICCIIFSNN